MINYVLANRSLRYVLDNKVFDPLKNKRAISNLPMMKRYTLSTFLLLFVLLLGSRVEAQPCNQSSTFTITPSPPGGVYAPGTTVQFCYTVNSWYFTSASWLHGVTIIVPNGWDASSLTPISVNTTCAGGNAGWVWVSSPATSQNGQTWGPGYFYDDNGDGNPFGGGLNYGQPCNGPWTFCFSLTTAVAGSNSYNAACSGSSGTSDIAPSINTSGDNESGGWTGGGNACTGDPNFFPTQTVDLQCCDATAGTSPSVQPVCTGATVNMFNLLGNNPDTGGSWTAPDGSAHSNIFDGNTDSPGVYTYTVQGTGGCTSSATVDFEIPESNVPVSLSACGGDTLDLLGSTNAQVTTNYPSGGTWTDPNGTVIANGILYSAVDSISGFYTYQYQVSGGCIRIIHVYININTSSGSGNLPSPGILTVAHFCSTDPIQNLNSLLNGNPDTSGVFTWTWIDDNGSYNYDVHTFDPATDPTSGYFKHAALFPNPCDPQHPTLDTARLVVIVDQVPNTGTSNSVTLCSNDPPVSLFSLLGGNPDTGGTWTDQSGNPVSSTIDPSTSSGGIFIYTLTNGACSHQSTLNVNITPFTVYAGTDTSITVCESSPLFVLSTGGNPNGGGIWHAPNGGFSNGNFIPGTNPAGVYTYVLSSSCGADSATVTVTVLPDPNPGNDASVTFCDQQGPVNLINYPGGSPQPGGTWTDPLGNSFSGTFNPATDMVGTYTYTVSNGICSESSSLTVSVENAPNAGFSNSITVCSADPSFPLFLQLGGAPDNTGTWTGPGGFSSSNSGVSFDPATNVSGVYTYTVAGTACSSQTATVTVTVTPIGNPGTNGALAICTNSSPVSLFNSLNGSPQSGGTWTNPGGTTLPNDSLDPATDPQGLYTYTVGSAGCTASATVNVTFLPTPNAGNPGTASVCSNGTPFDLIDSLGGNPDPSGLWVNPSGTFQGTDVFNPATSTPGTYTYLLSAPGCTPSQVSATVTVSVTPQPNAGNSSSMTLCANGPVVTCLDSVPGNPQPGGTWTAPSGGSFSGSFNPSSDTPGNYTYALDNNGCTASSTLNISVNNPPNAGTSASIQLCNNASAFNLIDSLSGASPGGTWTAPGGGAFNGTLQPGTSPAGTYTYTVSGNGICADASATVNVSYFPTLSVSAPVETCNAAETAYTVTFTISGGDPATYAVNGIPGTITGSTFTSSPITSGTGYNGTVTDGNGCQSITVSGTHTCTCNATASISGSTTICNGDQASLTIALSGTPPFDVVYSDGSTNSTLTGITNGYQLNVSPTSTTTYSLVSVHDANCLGTASGSATVTVNTPPNAGSDESLSLCSNAASVNLFSVIDSSGNANSGGTWTGPGGTASSGTLTPGTSPAGLYTYTVSGGGICPDASASVTVSYFPQLSVSTPVETCNAAQTDYTVTFTISGGDPTSYTVNGIAGSITGNTFTSNPILSGNSYSGTVSDANGCQSIAVSGTHTCSCSATAAISGDTTICNGDQAVLTFALSGNPPYDVVYSDGSTNTTLTGITDGYQEVVSPSSTTTYSLVSVHDADCQGSASGNVTVTVNTAPNAGQDASLTLCNNASSVNLGTSIAPSDPGGIWTAPGGGTSNGILQPGTSPAGNYTYLVSGGGICPDDSSVVTVAYYPTLSVSNPVETCNAAQTSYTVSFTISGGDPTTYVVNGITGTLTGNTFTSNPITSGTSYSGTVTDGNGCQSIPVSGTHNCNCNATASISGATNICNGDQATLTFTLGGTPPYDVVYSDGTNNITLTGIADGDQEIVSPTTTTTYSLVSVHDANCQGTASGSVTVNVNNPPNAGQGGSITLCTNSGSHDLNGDVTGADPNGQWYSPSGVALSGSTIDPSSSPAGTYSYVVTGSSPCPSDTSFVSVSYYPTLSVSSPVETCDAAQTSYTVSFTISGGDPGSYNVAGIAGSLSGNTFTSNPITSGSSYSGTVTDGNGCQSISISGTHNCTCNASATISGTTSICSGTSATLNFQFTGTGPFTVVYSDGTNQYTLNNLSNGATQSVSPTTTTTYTLVSMSDANCSGSVSGSAVVTVNSPPVASAETYSCDNTNENYTVTFTISGGDASSYTVTGGTGTLSGNTFVSDPIPTGASYSFTVNDANNCLPDVVSGSHSCGCTSNAGTMSTTPINECGNGPVLAQFQGGQVLDGNDLHKYILHTLPSAPTGTILATSPNASFSFIDSTMTYGVTYYISSVVGSSNGNGGIDFSDPCLSISQGTPVVFNPPFSASISGGGTICNGDSAEVNLSFSGTPSYTATILRNGITQNSQTYSTDSVSLFMSQQGVYTIQNPQDGAGCTTNSSGSAQVIVNTIPTATLSGDTTICAGSTDGPHVTFTGSGPYTFVYAIDGNPQPAIQTSGAFYTLPVTNDATYTLVSVSNGTCEGTVSGSSQVTIAPTPSASISGGGVICNGDSAQFTVHVSGEGPYTVFYSVNSFMINQPLVSSDSVITFSSDVAGTYQVTQVNDSLCSAAGNGSSADLVVNPIPSGTVDASTYGICKGQPVTFTFNLTGTPPYNISYSVNGQSFNVPNIYSGYSISLTPQNSTVVTLNQVIDNSSPSCYTPNQQLGQVFVDVHNLPNSPVLHNILVCSGADTVQIGSPPVQGYSYQWTPTTGLSNPNISNPGFAFETNSSDTVDIHYTLEASDGNCSSSAEMDAVVDPGPNPIFTYSPNPPSTEETTLKFSNLTQGDNVYVWNFDSLGTSSEANPTFSFPEDQEGVYYVTLTATDANLGCVNDVTQRIVIKAHLAMFVPTAFTPDGDGLNDLFGPVMKNIDPSDYHFAIYNRFGQMVFETTDPKQKWNGAMQSTGYFAETGVYIWVIKTKDKTTQKQVEYKGSVTLLR